MATKRAGGGVLGGFKKTPTVVVELPPAQRSQKLRTGNGRNTSGGRGRVATTSGVAQKPPNARPL